MQQVPSPPSHPAEVLVERISANRMILCDNVLRLAAMRLKTQEVRARNGLLRREIRRGLDVAAIRLDRVRQWRRSDVGAVSVRPRFTPPARDPLDAVRRQLHETYAATGDPAVRAELMASYDGFARSLALKFRHRESIDDLVQVARIGLLHAIDRFDPELGRPFPLFARITITGELKRYIRDRTWSMRVPRSLQEDYLNVMRAVDELTAESSSSPSMQALADRCGLSVERVVEAQELRVSQRTLSIDGPAVPGSDEPYVELGREDLAFRSLENRDLLASLLDRLPRRDRRIVELRFFDELTQSEIADTVGVSQMCVSRVLARTLGRLRLWARTAVS